VAVKVTKILDTEDDDTNAFIKDEI